MPTISGTPSEVQIGPGVIYVAPIGTTEPVNGSSALDAAFRQVGYTEDGNEFQYQITTADVNVAEVFDPIIVATTARKATFTFQMAQASRQNLALAINAATAAVNTGQGLAPPEVGAESRTVIVFEGQNGARWLLRRCIQGAAVSLKHQKAPNKTVIPVTFQLEIPASAAGSVPPGSTGLEPFWVFPTSAGLIS